MDGWRAARRSSCTRITGLTSTDALTGAGDLFTRVRGDSVRLRYRPELRTSASRLWRVELT